MSKNNDNKNSFTLSIYGTLNGDPISPDNISLADLSRFTESFGKLLRGGEEEVSLKEVPVSIKKGCLSISINPDYQYTPAMIHDYRVLTDGALGEGISSVIDPVRAAELNNLQAISKGSDDRKYVISYEDKKLTIDSSTNYQIIDKPIYVDVDEYVYGEITDMGGQTPNVHLTTNDGQTIIVPAGKELLMNAGNKLYRNQLVHVSAKEDIATGKKSNYTLISFEAYNPKWDEDEFNRLVEFYTPRLEDIDDPEALIANMRGYANA